MLGHNNASSTAGEAFDDHDDVVIDELSAFDDEDSDDVDEENFAEMPSARMSRSNFDSKLAAVRVIARATGDGLGGGVWCQFTLRSPATGRRRTTHGLSGSVRCAVSTA